MFYTLLYVRLLLGMNLCF